METQNYTTRFKEGLARRYFLKNEYIRIHSLEGKPIKSTVHPEYFKIDNDWDKLRAELDKPFLEKAYYKVGDELMFVKTNTYADDDGKPYILADKKYMVYSDDKDYNSSHCRTFYYENVLCKGIVSGIKTSGDGSSEIVYYFDELIPKCPEVNPIVLERHVISKCELSQEHILQKDLINKLSVKWVRVGDDVPKGEYNTILFRGGTAPTIPVWYNKGTNQWFYCENFKEIIPHEDWCWLRYSHADFPNAKF